MAAELVMTGDGPKVGTAVDDREFSIVRRGYDRGEVKAYLAEIEANLRVLEGWAQRTNARLAISEEKNRAIADVDEAMVAIYEAKERMLEQAEVDAEKIKAEATDQARAEAEIVATEIVAEAQEKGRRITETAAATARSREQSVLAAAKTEADRLMRDTRAEADQPIDDARAQAAMLRIVEPPEPSTDEGPKSPDQLIGSANASRLIVDMEGLQVDLDGSADRETPAASSESPPVVGDEADEATKRSRYERTSAKLPSIGKGANEVFGVIERLRKSIHDV